MDNLNVRALASEIFTINTICILKEDLLMKIIDQKGRLLGKINVIDFLAIIFFLSFVPMFYFGYKNLHKKPSDPAAQNVESQKKEFIQTKLSFVFKKVLPQVLSLISSGDKEIGKDKETMGEILSLGEVRPYNYEVVIGSSKKVIVDSVYKDLPVTLRIKAELRQNNLYYKDRQINENSTIDFVTDRYKVDALYASTLVESNNHPEDLSDSIKRIQQKQKEMEYALSILLNKLDFLDNKIGSMETALTAKNKTKGVVKER